VLEQQCCFFSFRSTVHCKVKYNAKLNHSRVHFYPVMRAGLDWWLTSNPDTVHRKTHSKARARVSRHCHLSACHLSRRLPAPLVASVPEPKKWSTPLSAADSGTRTKLANLLSQRMTLRWRHLYGLADAAADGFPWRGWCESEGPEKSMRATQLKMSQGSALHFSLESSFPLQHYFRVRTSCVIIIRMLAKWVTSPGGFGF